MISQYWVGQIPNRPLSILVKDSEGVNMDLSIYTTIKLKMLGTYNEELDVSGGVLDTNAAVTGKIIYKWPTTKSLFDYPGIKRNGQKRFYKLSYNQSKRTRKEL